MVKKLLLWGFLLLEITISSQEWNPPFCKISQQNFTSPESIFDCIEQLDRILKPEIIDHYGELESKIAVIEISKMLGYFFINKWDLDYYSTYSTNSFDFSRKSKPNELVKKFRENHLSHPQIILRVIFNCYHKKLNNINFNFEDEISRAKKEYNWCYKNSTPEKNYNTKLTIENHEDSILMNYRIHKLEAGDTIGTYYIEKKRNTGTYLTGIIKKVDIESQRIIVNLIDIASNMRYRNAYIDNKVAYVGDSIKIDCKNWYKLEEKYFNYYLGIEKYSLPNWQEYIKLKFPEWP